MDQFNHQHAVETFKSLISISVEGLKALILLNGGAVIAILAYLGQLHSQHGQVVWARRPVAWFVTGLISAGLCFMGSYFTQLALYQESIHGKKKTHDRWLWVTFAFAFASIGAFAVGSFTAVAALS